MAVQHEDATDPNIHEPKGASTASVDTVYVMDGSGSGVYEKITSDSLNKTSIDAYIQASLDADDVTVDLSAAKKMNLTVVIDDISTAASVYVAVPVTCTFTGARSVLGGAITVADANISFADASGNSMGTAMVVAFTGSAAGITDSFTPTANNALTGPTYVKISTDGGSTDAAKLYLTLSFDVT